VGVLDDLATIAASRIQPAADLPRFTVITLERVDGIRP
jgi:hypothetical protein